MAKILISSLGTGQKRDGGYRNAVYEYKNKQISTPFISKALCEFLDIDKVFLVGTNGSIWDSAYREFGGNDENIEFEIYEKTQNKTLSYDDLEIVNNQINLYLNNSGSKSYLIDYGINEDELWGNFSKYLEILDNLDKNDEVYIDISHSFRSLAMFSFIMLQFANSLEDKNINLKGVFYGMLEYSFENNGITPIIDLKIFFELLEWAKAIEEMEKFSSLDRLVTLSSGKIEKNGFSNLNNMAQAFEIANMTAIYNSINKLKTHLNYFSENENKIIKLISPRIEVFIKRLSKNTLSDFQFELAKFFSEKHNYALAYIALAEAVVTRICEKNNLDENNKDDRDKAKDIIHNYTNYPSQTSQKKFRNIFFKQINKIRNNIAHQLETNKNPKQDIENFDKYFSDSKKYLKELF